MAALHRRSPPRATLVSLIHAGLAPPRRSARRRAAGRLRLSLFGVAGVGAGWDERFEVNDVTSPGLKLPGVGRVGLR